MALEVKENLLSKGEMEVPLDNKGADTKARKFS